MTGKLSYKELLEVNRNLRRILEIRIKELDAANASAKDMRAFCEHAGSEVRDTKAMVSKIVNSQIDLRTLSRDPETNEETRRCLATTVSFLEGRESALREIGKLFGVRFDPKTQDQGIRNHLKV